LLLLIVLLRNLLALLSPLCKILYIVPKLNAIE